MKLTTVEARYPHKRAREAADDAIDRMPVTASMAEHIDTWLRVYLATGGTVRR